MRLKQSSLMIAAVMLAAPAARAGEIWQWTHEAAGEGRANVSEGGPVGLGSMRTTGPARQAGEGHADGPGTGRGPVPRMGRTLPAEAEAARAFTKPSIEQT